MDPAEQGSVEAAFTHQAAVNERHEQLLQNLSSGMNQLASSFARLSTTEAREGPRTPDHLGDPVPPVQTALGTRDAPMSPPPIFHGEPADCRAFLTQCGMVLEFQPQAYPTDRARIAFIISRLGGAARSWATTLWEQQAEEVTSYSRFTSAMRLVFDQPTYGEVSADRLLTIRQGTGSTAEYSVRFRTMAATSKWNEPSLRAVFVQGLTAQLQDELAYRDAPASLDSLISLSIRIDNRLRARRRQRLGEERRGRDAEDGVSTHQLRPNPGAGQRTGPTWAPAQIGTHRSVGNSGEPSPEPMQLGRARLTEQEKRYRRQKGVCFYCGEADHVVRQCPVCPGND